MAVKKQWTMTVRNINDEQIRVLIKERGATSSDTWEYYTLHPSENSIVLQEDSDPWATVIKTTGYIKFLRENGDTTPFPSADSAIYIDNITTGEAIFRGFLAREHYESDLFECLEECTCNIYDIFGALDFSLDERGISKEYISWIYVTKSIAAHLEDLTELAGYKDALDLYDYVQVSYATYSFVEGLDKEYVEDWSESDPHVPELPPLYNVSRALPFPFEEDKFDNVIDAIAGLLEGKGTLASIIFYQIGTRGNVLYIRDKLFASAAVTFYMDTFKSLRRDFTYSDKAGFLALNPNETTIHRRDVMDVASLDLFDYYTVYGTNNKSKWVEPIHDAWKRKIWNNQRYFTTAKGNNEIGSVFHDHRFNIYKNTSLDDWTFAYELDLKCNIPASGIAKDVVIHTVPTAQFPNSHTLSNRTYIHRFDPMFAVNYGGKHYLIYSIDRNVLDDTAVVRLRSVKSFEESLRTVNSWY